MKPGRFHPEPNPLPPPPVPGQHAIRESVRHWVQQCRYGIRQLEQLRLPEQQEFVAGARDLLESICHNIIERDRVTERQSRAIQNTVRGALRCLAYQEYIEGCLRDPGDMPNDAPGMGWGGEDGDEAEAFDWWLAPTDLPF